MTGLDATPFLLRLSRQPLPASREGAQESERICDMLKMTQWTVFSGQSFCCSQSSQGHCVGWLSRTRLHAPCTCDFM